MNKLLKTMAAVVLAASIIPAHATSEVDELTRMEINKQTSACANTLAPFVTGTIFGTAGAISGAVAAAAGKGMIHLGVGGACGIAALTCMAKWRSLYNTYKNKFGEDDVKAIDWKTEELAFRLNFMALGAVIAPILAIGGLLAGGFVGSLVSLPLIKAATALGVSSNAAKIAALTARCAIPAALYTFCSEEKQIDKEIRTLEVDEKVGQFVSLVGLAGAFTGFITGINTQIQVTLPL